MIKDDVKGRLGQSSELKERTYNEEDIQVRRGFTGIARTRFDKDGGTESTWDEEDI